VYSTSGPPAGALLVEVPPGAETGAGVVVVVPVEPDEEPTVVPVDPVDWLPLEPDEEPEAPPVDPVDGAVAGAGEPGVAPVDPGVELPPEPDVAVVPPVGAVDPDDAASAAKIARTLWVLFMVTAQLADPPVQLPLQPENV
jgi:hypothetical protein